MPRREKPPDKERWTWDEINAGRKLSKTEKRWRNLHVSFGATKDSDARIVPPKYEDNPRYWYFFAGMLVLMLVILFARIIGGERL